MASDNEQPALNLERARLLEHALTTTREALTRLRYGAITLTVHDGILVQMDVTERLRFKER